MASSQILGNANGKFVTLINPDTNNSDVVVDCSDIANKQYVDEKAVTSWVTNDSRAKTALNASGDAPIYACRAWVNFNGTGTVAIRKSGNVSSITDNGIGDYTVNFTKAMEDNNYSGICSGSNGGSARLGFTHSLTEFTTTSCRATHCDNNSDNSVDVVMCSISIFR